MNLGELYNRRDADFFGSMNIVNLRLIQATNH